MECTAPVPIILSKMSCGQYNTGTYKVFLSTPFSITWDEACAVLSQDCINFCFLGLLYEKACGFCWCCFSHLFLMGKNINRFSDLALFSKCENYGQIYTNYRRKCMLMPEGSIVWRMQYTIVSLMCLNIQCLAYDFRDFVIDFETTLCFYSILFYILLYILSTQREFLCENLGSSPVSTHTFKQPNNPIVFWGISHVFEAKHSYSHLQESNLLKVLWTMWITIINEFLSQQKWLSPTPSIAVAWNKNVILTLLTVFSQ